MIRKLVAVIAFACALPLIGAGATHANNLEECRQIDATKGSVFGDIHILGEPWVHTWKNVTTTSVPGTDIEFRFDDGTALRWWNSDTKHGEKADTLTTFVRGITEHEYYVASRNDGSIAVTIDRDDDYCGTWLVIQPTIFPSGWEDHPLSRCFKGAYRVTDQVAFETNQSLVANFDGELVKLYSNFGLTPDVVVVEIFDGFYAIEDNGGACSRTYLEEAP